MNVQDQIKELNKTVTCRLGVSKIHGVGAFAIRDINQGETMYCHFPDSASWQTVPYKMFNKIRPEVRKIILQQWTAVINGSHFISPNVHATPVCYMNHSDDPNYDPVKDEAIRDIKKGEEVTEDYGEYKQFLL